MYLLSYFCCCPFLDFFLLALFLFLVFLAPFLKKCTLWGESTKQKNRATFGKLASDRLIQRGMSKKSHKLSIT